MMGAKYPGGMIGNVPKFNRKNTAYVEAANEQIAEAAGYRIGQKVILEYIGRKQPEAGDYVNDSMRGMFEWTGAPGGEERECFRRIED